jgi:hypothetical protein
MYNLARTVKYPTGTAHNICSLMDVMITILNLEKQTIIYDGVYYDHLTQIVYIKVNKPVLCPTVINKTQLTGNAIEEFMYLLHKETWDKVLLSESDKISFNAFMITFMYTISTQCFL